MSMLCRVVLYLETDRTESSLNLRLTFLVRLQVTALDSVRSGVIGNCGLTFCRILSARGVSEGVDVGAEDILLVNDCTICGRRGNFIETLDSNSDPILLYRQL